MMLLCKRYLFVGALLLFAMNTYSLRDPTRPPNIPEANYKAPTKLVLNSIIQSDKRSFAIINAKKLEVGDMIAGSKLLKIEKTAVYLEDGDEIIKLFLVPLRTDK